MNYMSIPFFSFSQAPESLKSEWKVAIANVITNGRFIQGEQVKAFQENWASKIGSRFAIGTSNGQDGLILALRALGIKSGDNVVVPAHSFIATHNAVLALGANIISVDVNEEGLIDVESLENLFEKIAAVIVVHMHGQVCDMESVSKWIQKNNIKLIEDCSQAHLSSTTDRYAGTWGDIGVFSLYPTKNLGALGDAGVIVTNDEELAEKVFKFANYGSSSKDKYFHSEFGLNHRLDELQASILNVNLQYLEIWNKRRIEISEKYLHGLDSNLMHFLQKSNVGNVRHHFCILVSDRDNLRLQLENAGIGTEIHYPRLASHEVEQYLGQTFGNYPNALRISQQTLSLPMSPWMTNEEVYQVIDVVNKLSSKY
jgi:dTDP-4-amino-4,6-dideoxygalactose transaminase